MIFVRRDKTAILVGNGSDVICIGATALSAHKSSHPISCAPRFHQHSVSVDGYVFTDLSGFEF